MIDGGLRQMFAKKLPSFFFVSIETGSTGRGIFDSYFVCGGGIGGWLEFKKAKGNRLGIRPEQVAFCERLVRYGGRPFFAVRKKVMTSDTLWLLGPGAARAVTFADLSPSDQLGTWVGGPARWDWDWIGAILAGRALDPA